MSMRRTVVRSSPVHGRGVFALTPITAGDVLFEYKGTLRSWKEAQRRYERSAAKDGHPSFFDLGDRRPDRRRAGRKLGTLGEPRMRAELRKPSRRAVASTFTPCATLNQARNCSSTIGCLSRDAARSL